jgi:hypothetical protein
MATGGNSNRGGNSNFGGNNRSRNNNPEGRNQYSSGILGTAKDRPFTAAATAAAAVGAGVFLWSKRNQISEQLTNLSDQISDWRDNMQSSDESDFEMAGAGDSGAAIGTTSARTSRSAGSRATATKGRSGGLDDTGGSGI